jgi:hypothetical protein
MKVWVYIDGFNLYNGMIRGTPYRWLNLLEVCRKLLPQDDVERLKYFTARVDPRVGDPDQPLRQMRYWRALRTLGCVEIILGHFLTAPKTMPELASAERIDALAAQGVDIRGMRPTMVRVRRRQRRRRGFSAPGEGR